LGRPVEAFRSRVDAAEGVSRCGSFPRPLAFGSGEIGAGAEGPDVHPGGVLHDPAGGFKLGVDLFAGTLFRRHWRRALSGRELCRSFSNRLAVSFTKELPEAWQRGGRVGSGRWL
jgi:hypothetical protein